MKLLKIIVLIFIIYVIRRFFQLYKKAKEIQTRNYSEQSSGPANQKNKDVIDADYKVVK